MTITKDEIDLFMFTFVHVKELKYTSSYLYLNYVYQYNNKEVLPTLGNGHICVHIETQMSIHMLNIIRS